MAVNWRGAQVAAKANAAARLAIDQTMARCVTHAKHNHGWENRTGTLEGSLRIADPAATHGHVTAGRWGSVNVMYAIFLEFLVGEIMGDTGWERRKSGGSPYLRPAADAEYPLLRLRVAQAFRGERML